MIRYSIIAGLFWLTACAVQPVHDDDSLSYWWYARYRIAPADNGMTNWPVDLLIADRMVEPVLEKYRNRIRLWRFHRRSVDDRAGHQFSFIFYTDKKTAGNIYASLQSEPLTQILLDKNILRRFLPDMLSGNQRTSLNATSDKNWSPSMQKHWPEYIMGVSELWLGLINELVHGHADNVDDMLAEYARVDGEIKSLWYEEGNHALYHHLHAIFGYPPPADNE